MHVVVLVVLATKLCPTLWDPTNCSLPVSSIHGIFQASMLEWIAISFSRRYSWPRDWTPVSCIGRQILYRWATREAQLSAFVFYTWEDWPQCHHLTALPFSPGLRQAKYTSCSFTGMYTVNKHAKHLKTQWKTQRLNSTQACSCASQPCDDPTQELQDFTMITLAPWLSLSTLSEDFPMYQLLSILSSWWQVLPW